MSVVGKSSTVLACLCMLTPVAFAQNKTDIIKYLNPKQNVLKTLQNITRVPSKYVQATALDEVRRAHFQHAVLDGLDMALERQALQAAQAQRQKSRADKWNFVYGEIDKIRVFLVRGRWPEYQRNLPVADMVKRINAWMEVENPDEYVRALQENLIYERWCHRARKPEELVVQVSRWLEQGRVPPRAFTSTLEKYTDQEIALGEDLAFAIKAREVVLTENGVEHHPWQIPEMAEIADKVTTYWAMRRSNAQAEGLPETDMEGTPNFPVWTRAAFVQHQRSWVEAHPFEYALAGYWEKTFGHSLYKVYNGLSQIEKEAILFVAPNLPQVADVTAASFSAYYDKALEKWITTHNHVPFSHVGMDKEEYFGKALADPVTYPMNLHFQNSQRQWVDFVDLSYREQLEVLLWIWQKYRILPQTALEIMGKPSARYY